MKIFLRALPLRAVVIGLIHYMLLLNVKVHLLRIFVANVSELPPTLNIYGHNIYLSFVLRNKGTLVCNLSSSVFKRTSPSLLYTFVVDSLLNVPMPFNKILTCTNTPHVNAFRRLLVLFFI